MRIAVPLGPELTNYMDVRNKNQRPCTLRMARSALRCSLLPDTSPRGEGDPNDAPYSIVAAGTGIGGGNGLNADVGEEVLQLYSDCNKNDGQAKMAPFDPDVDPRSELRAVFKIRGEILDALLSGNAGADAGADAGAELFQYVCDKYDEVVLEHSGDASSSSAGPPGAAAAMTTMSMSTSSSSSAGPGTTMSKPTE